MKVNMPNCIRNLNVFKIVFFFICVIDILNRHAMLLDIHDDVESEKCDREI